jgi:hypothetical protein
MRTVRRPSPVSRTAIPAVLLLVAGSLLAAVAGGLLRGGVGWPWLPDSALPARTAVGHASLMMSGFFGTVVAIERAVAVRLYWAFTAPLTSALASLLLLAGHPAPAAWVWVYAASIFVAVNMVVVMRQPAPHTALLLAGALAWLVGNLCLAAGLPGIVHLYWWFAFLVLTIGAERLEMTRLMRRHPAAQPALLGIVLVLLAGAVLSEPLPRGGGLLYGAALTGLAIWLSLFDIARRTVFAHGLSRYMAVCLLTGYVWLGIAGVAWAAMAMGWPTRDIALHALGLGFIGSMAIGHAPVILPAVARIKLYFGHGFYGPLVLLHTSLALRLATGQAEPSWHAAGLILNAMALGYFAANIVVSAMAWRSRNTATSTRTFHAPLDLHR